MGGGGTADEVEGKGGRGHGGPAPWVISAGIHAGLSAGGGGAGGTLARMPAPPAPAADWLVACLCAGWCRTCDDYRAVMAEAARRHPGLRFAWVDIEDHADALDDPDGAADDIETFPTLLVARGGVAHFFGSVLPHAAVLERLLAEAAAGQLPPRPAAPAPRLARAVEQLWRAAPPGLRVGG